MHYLSSSRLICENWARCFLRSRWREERFPPSFEAISHRDRDYDDDDIFASEWRYRHWSTTACLPDSLCSIHFDSHHFHFRYRVIQLRVRAWPRFYPHKTIFLILIEGEKGKKVAARIYSQSFSCCPFSAIFWAIRQLRHWRRSRKEWMRVGLKLFFLFHPLLLFFTRWIYETWPN